MWSRTSNSLPTRECKLLKPLQKTVWTVLKKLKIELPYCMHAKSLQSCPTLSTLWTTASQAPLSMGFLRQEHWSGLSCLPSGDLPDPGIKPASLMPPALAGGFFTTSAPPGKPIWSSDSTPGHISRQNYDSKRYRHPVFIATLFIIVKTWKLHKCSSTDEWIKMPCIHIMEYYSAIKNNEIMPFVAWT